VVIMDLFDVQKEEGLMIAKRGCKVRRDFGCLFYFLRCNGIKDGQQKHV